MWALYALRHVKIVLILNGNMQSPACVDLAGMDTGLGKYNPVKVVVSTLEPLRQGITAKGAIHAEDVRLGYAL